ncbi:methyl-accepting chemotaxis protein [Motiliproteus sp. MSK22-1]|uniref:methyl-accepting chemotaxis protein n=1 Tax=Motiliproteus sp. MSK22-1 TaxID=1897630 RepID=UPI000977F41A|nr:methyl-accepting chemotaxis protein [Motiliproteus sp. MSK22-1]OMH29460.1 hypothetical protein BGP75_19615 [Motiliproteus sp. MSK22-1]
MNNLVSQLKVRSKLMLVVAVALVGIMSSQALSLTELWKDLNKSKAQQLQYYVDIAYSVLEREAGLVSEGKISEDQARNEAIAALRALRYAGLEYFFVLDQQHTMIMHPFKPELEGTSVKAVKDPNGKPLFAEMVKVSQSSGDGYVDYFWDRPGETELIGKLTYVKSFPQWGWVVGTGVYTDDIDKAFWDEVWVIARNTTGIIVLMLVMVVLISRAIVLPVVSLRDQMVQVTKTRDLTNRSNLSGSDEIAEMGKAFDGMLDSFNEVLHEISAATSQVASASTELSVTTNQTQAGMESQKDETRLVATAMTEMSATVHDVAENISDAATASHNASLAADNGKNIVHQAMSSVTDLSNKLLHAESLTHTLETQSGNISAIIEVITGIAEQTNLLALNAAIEAARAGEQGRGFAVVADEVRNLSTRTHESTREINDLIQNLQSGSQAAATAMMESKAAAELVVDQAKRAQSSLDEITESVSRIDVMTAQVASASEEQSAVAEEINMNIVNISKISEQSAVGAEQIARSSEELAQLSDHLKQMSERFTVSA